LDIIFDLLKTNLFFFDIFVPGSLVIFLLKSFDVNVGKTL